MKLPDEVSTRALPSPAADGVGGGPLVQALEWLADGVALLADDGGIVHANHAFQAIARRNDGITTRDGKIVLADAAALIEFQRAILDVLAPRAGSVTRSGAFDLAVAQSGGAAWYLLSVRPITTEAHADGAGSKARALVLVREPLSRNTVAVGILCDALQLTEAEAMLAQALQAGVGLQDHARTRGISINTIYTHLRSIKQKTHCRRMGELIRRLNDFQAAARAAS